MNDLFEIYKRIEYLRNKGVKMKDIADKTNMPASVLSLFECAAHFYEVGEERNDGRRSA